MRHTRQEIQDTILEILRERISVDLGRSSVTEETGLLGQGVGIDSIEAVQLVLGLEASIGVFIDDDDMLPEHFQTIGTMIDLIERLEAASDQ